jgi:hypothetical protein
VLHRPQIRSEVAVIVPCYNVENQLQRALDSVFRQTYLDFHVYAVDDGSGDGTGRILEKNAHRCSFVTQLNRGPAAARNRALQISDSPFVAFLDADDEWLPNKLEHQIAVLKQDPSLGLVCSHCLVNEPETQSRHILDRSAPGAGKLFERLVRGCFVFTPTVVVRRRCLEEVGVFNESLTVSEDFNLWLRIASRWNIVLLPEALAITHKRVGSLSASIAPEKRLKNGIEALEDVLSRSPALSAAEFRALRDALADRHYFHGSFLLSSGSKKPARLSLKNALRFRSTHWRALVKLGLSALPVRAFRSLAGIRTKLAGRMPAGNSTQLTQGNVPQIGRMQSREERASLG